EAHLLEEGVHAVGLGVDGERARSADALDGGRQGVRPVDEEEAGFWQRGGRGHLAEESSPPARSGSRRCDERLAVRSPRIGVSGSSNAAKRCTARCRRSSGGTPPCASFSKISSASFVR